MTRSKNSTKLVALLMSLVLITSCFVGGTLARYITSTSSEDSARVAVWGINADEVEMDLFDAQYELDGTVVAKANDGDNIIAPGTGKMSKFSIVNLDDTLAPEVMYEVRIDLDDTEIDQRILDNPSIQWKLDDNSWGTWETTKADILALSGDASGVKTYAPNTVATEFANGVEHTISWQWLLDNNNDTQDTAMGNEAVDEDISAKIVVKITAEQTDGSSTGMLNGKNQILYLNNIQPLIFRSAAPLSELQSVEINGITLTKDTDYTATEGSTVITLSEDYLSTLEVGTYEIKIISENMTATANFQVKNMFSEYVEGYIYGTPNQSYELGSIILPNQTSHTGTFVRIPVNPGESWYFEMPTNENATAFRLENENNELVQYINRTTLYEEDFNPSTEIVGQVLTIPNNVKYLCFTIKMQGPNRNYDYSQNIFLTKINFNVSKLVNEYEYINGYVYSSETSYYGFKKGDIIPLGKTEHKGISIRIPVKPGENWYFEYPNNTAKGIRLEDSNKDFIQYIDRTTLYKEEHNLSTEIVGQILTIPNNVEYICLNLMIQGTNYNFNYSNQIFLKKITNYQQPTKWTIIGDSVCEENYGGITDNWISYAANDLGIFYTNLAQAGHGYKRDSVKTYLKFLDSIPEDTDLITIYGSWNDINSGTNIIGTVNDVFVENEDNTLAAHMNYIYDYIQTNYPNATLAVIAPAPSYNKIPNGTSELDLKAQEYVDVMEEICETKNIPFLKLFNNSNMTPWNENFNNEYYVNADGRHPNEEGHLILAQDIIPFLENLINN